MARKTYTREFKLQAVKMITAQGLSVAEVARRLGVTEGALRTWRATALEHGDAAFPGHGHSTPTDDEVRRLRAENARLRAERGSPKKGRRHLRQPAGLTYRFIADHRGDCPVAWACHALDVSESGYHAWVARSPSPAEERRGNLVAAIKVIHAEVKGRYGSPRMTAELNARGTPARSTRWPG